MEEQLITTFPLIPISAHTITITDILLPPLLIGIALILFDITTTTTPDPHSSHIFSNRTNHQRHHHHHFNYHLIQFGFNLDHLEQNLLDIPHLFRFNNHHKPIHLYNPSTWINILQLFSISPSNYFKSPIQQSIKLSLFQLLESTFNIHQPHQHIGRVYLLTIPTYLGFTSTNPLSIYFCYHQQDNKSLKYVVLDLQNTFSERHSYLLTIGVNEQPTPQSGFQHEWIIPKAFHVSHFNDRAGFYKISLSDPFSNTSPDSDPTLKFKMALLEPSGETKFVATLNGAGIPFTTRNLVRTWLQYPMVLFMTRLRILYQSYNLHMGKPRLDIYPRPEPVFDPEHALKGPDPIQPGGVMGATGWQEPDWSSRWAQNIVVDYLTQRVNQIAAQSCHAQASKSLKPHSEDPLENSFVDLGNDTREESLDGLSENDDHEDADFKHPSMVTVVLQPADQSQSIITISPPISEQSETIRQETLTIHYGTPKFFTDLIVYPTPWIAQLIGDSTEATWKVSSVGLFERVFEGGYGGRGGAAGPVRLGTISGRISGLINGARAAYFGWLLSFVSMEEPEMAPLRHRASWLPPPNFVSIHARPFVCGPSPIDLAFLAPSHSTRRSLAILAILLYTLCARKSAYFLYHHLLRLRFVHHTHPWLVLKRTVLAANHILPSQTPSSIDTLPTPAPS